MILVIHRKEEKEDYINLTTSFLTKNGRKCVSLKDDKKIHHIGNFQSYIHNAVKGFNLEGEERFSSFILIGKYLDEQCRKICKVAVSTNKPIFCLTDNKFSPVTQWTQPDSDLISEVIL